jgi:hypothetical protein
MRSKEIEEARNRYEAIVNQVTSILVKAHLKQLGITHLVHVSSDFLYSLGLDQEMDEIRNEVCSSLEQELFTTRLELEHEQEKLRAEGKPIDPKPAHETFIKLVFLRYEKSFFLATYDELTTDYSRFKSRSVREFKTHEIRETPLGVKFWLGYVPKIVPKIPESLQ